MKKIIKYQSPSLMQNDKKGPYTIMANDYKKTGYKIFLLISMLFFGMYYSSFGNTPLTKGFLPIEKSGPNSTSVRSHKKSAREEKRMIRQVEDISSTTMNLFAQEFPKAHHVSWTSTAGFAEADFTCRGSKRLAFYDYDNGLVGTGKYISYKDLPVKSFAQIDKSYKDYTPEQVIYYDDNELNENNANVFGATVNADSYYALMKNNNTAKEIVLQITPDGEVMFFSNLK